MAKSQWFSLFALGMVVVSVIAKAEQLQLNREYPPADERDSIRTLLDGVRAGYAAEGRRLADVERQIAALTRDGKVEEANRLRLEQGRVRRDAHARHHGCVKATFRVLENLPRRVRKGVFKYDRNGRPKTYKAWIRFSNGSEKAQVDWIPDGRGMAIKLTDVPGAKLLRDERRTQDFLMINFPEFFSRNARDYVGFSRAKAEGTLAAYFSAPERRDTEGRIARGIAAQFVTSPLEAQYFSMVPVRLGGRAIKYSARPCDPQARTMQVGDLDLRPLAQILRTVQRPEDLATRARELQPYNGYLATVLTRQMAERNQTRCFDFMVQFQTNANTQRIEDPTDHWDSEFINVARITFETQNVNAEGKDTFCENLTMTPWHAISAHTPIGGIQRVRKEVYQVSTQLRHQHNRAAHVEPTGNEF